jgi:serine/threonine-protein kinase RsbW
MSNSIVAVDPMVMTLRSKVAPVIADDTRFRFEIGVTEALANLVTHAPTTAPDGQIKIILNVDAGRALVEIFDPVGAAPFDLRNHATDLSEVDEMAEGGRGLGLIVECADDVKYGPSGEGNSLTLEFWDQRSASESARPDNGASK